MYDAHTHLNNETMYPQRKSYVDLFLQSGGKGIVNAGASDFYNEKGIEIAKEALLTYPDLRIKSTIGFHPLECVEKIITKENYLSKIQELKQQYIANKESVVAIGEIGIDVHFPGGQETLDFQKEVFSLQCDFAQELHLPIVVHSRDEFYQTIDVLQHYKNQIIYFHCWGYGPEEYRMLNDQFPNLFIGFCGNITYKNANLLRDTLEIVQTDQLVLETDAPYLAPQIIRGQTNHPAHVNYIYEYVCDILKTPKNVIEKQIEKNIFTLYKK